MIGWIRGRGASKRSRRVLALAGKGMAAPEIARRTGLSRDAVAMLLARRNLPEPAPIAAPSPRRGAAHRSSASAQVVAAR